MLKIIAPVFFLLLIGSKALANDEIYKYTARIQEGQVLINKKLYRQEKQEQEQEQEQEQLPEKVREVATENLPVVEPKVLGTLGLHQPMFNDIYVRTVSSNDIYVRTVSSIATGILESYIIKLLPEGQTGWKIKAVSEGVFFIEWLEGEDPNRQLTPVLFVRGADGGYQEFPLAEYLPEGQKIWRIHASDEGGFYIEWFKGEFLNRQWTSVLFVRGADGYQEFPLAGRLPEGQKITEIKAANKGGFYIQWFIEGNIQWTSVLFVRAADGGYQEFPLAEHLSEVQEISQIHAANEGGFYIEWLKGEYPDIQRTSVLFVRGSDGGYQEFPLAGRLPEGQGISQIHAANEGDFYIEWLEREYPYRQQTSVLVVRDPDGGYQVALPEEGGNAATANITEASASTDLQSPALDLEHLHLLIQTSPFKG